MRVGIFGGSFDPVHQGHLLMAEFAWEQARLDEVRFLPAAIAPHKQDRQPVAAKDRVEMLQLAIGGHESFKIDSRELERGGVSYTVETLRELTDELPEAELFLILGGDSLADLPGWREPQQLCQLAMPLVIARVGNEQRPVDVLRPLVETERLDQIEQQVVRMPLIELSSSEIRRRVAANQSIRYQTPRAVEELIRSRGLYQ